MITTYYNSEFSEKPFNKLTRDSRGIEIKEGLTVAYNKSGDVVRGIIQKVTKNKWLNVIIIITTFNLKWR